MSYRQISYARSVLWTPFVFTFEKREIPSSAILFNQNQSSCPVCPDCPVLTSCRHYNIPIFRHFPLIWTNHLTHFVQIVQSLHFADTTTFPFSVITHWPESTLLPTLSRLFSPYTLQTLQHSHFSSPPSDLSQLLLTLSRLSSPYTLQTLQHSHFPSPPTDLNQLLPTLSRLSSSYTLQTLQHSHFPSLPTDLNQPSSSLLRSTHSVPQNVPSNPFSTPLLTQKLPETTEEEEPCWVPYGLQAPTTFSEVLCSKARRVEQAICSVNIYKCMHTPPHQSALGGVDIFTGMLRVEKKHWNQKIINFNVQNKGWLLKFLYSVILKTLSHPLK